MLLRSGRQWVLALWAWRETRTNFKAGRLGLPTARAYSWLTSDRSDLGVPRAEPGGLGWHAQSPSDGRGRQLNAA